MKIAKVDLGNQHSEIEIHLFADEHIGDANSDIKRIKARIDEVLNKPNAYCILNGDILDIATRNSIGDIESRKYNIQQQIEKAVELFGPLADAGKIIGVTGGNHEGRLYKTDGIDITRCISAQLGLLDRFSDASLIIFLKFGREKHSGKTRRRACVDGTMQTHTKEPTFIIFCNHGSGGGRKEGSKANRLADMASIVDADIYIHSHTHLPMIMKEDFFRTSRNNACVTPVTKLFVNTASNLDYGGYGDIQEYKPASKDMPIIFIDSYEKKYTAKL